MTESTAAPELWVSDTGTLREPSRRVLVQLLRGPYLSAARHANLWTALLADEDAIRSRLADLFLDLVTDTAAEIAFVRNTAGDIDAPKVMRTITLTFLDTALLLHLRQALLAEGSGDKSIVGADEVVEALHAFRGQESSDEAGFGKRIATSWTKMVKYGLLAETSTPGRFEVSPVLRLIFGADEIAAVNAEYQALARSTAEDGPALPETNDPTTTDGEQP